MILNYFFIGFVCTFMLDYLSHKFKNHPSWEGIPEWGWGARIMFILFWPIGFSIFIYSYIKTYFKK